MVDIFVVLVFCLSFGRSLVCPFRNQACPCAFLKLIQRMNIKICFFAKLQ